VTAAEVTASTFEILAAQTPHAVIGILPPEFLFPTAHQVWLPLREEQAASPDEGRDLLIMGRLADGVSADEAQAEVTALPAPAEASEERSRLQLQVVPFGLRGFVPWRPVLPCCSAVLVPPSPMFAKVCRPIEAGVSLYPSASLR
jgi:hypothetical protein